HIPLTPKADRPPSGAVQRHAEALSRHCGASGPFAPGERCSHGFAESQCPENGAGCWRRKHPDVSPAYRPRGRGGTGGRVTGTVTVGCPVTVTVTRTPTPGLRFRRHGRAAAVRYRAQVWR